MASWARSRFVTSEIVVTVIAGLFSLGVAWIGAKRVKDHRKRVRGLQHTLRMRSQVLSMSRWVGYWVELDREIEAILYETEIDRIYIAVAWNGKLAPEWVTVTRQYTRPGGMQRVLVQAEIDDHYRSMMVEAERKGRVIIDAQTLPESLLNDLYQSEGVVQSAIYFVGSVTNGDDSREVDFCSFATYEGSGISPGTLLRCNLLVSRFRALVTTTSTRRIES